MIKKSCKDGKHDLALISSHHSWDDSAQVVKWCRDCGFVRVDLEYDNRIQTIRSMKPKTYDN